jgi:hypothetical protein
VAVLPCDKEPRHVGWRGFRHNNLPLPPGQFYTPGLT